MTYDPLIWLKVTSLSSTASKGKGVKNQESSEFLMIQPTLSDQNAGAPEQARQARPRSGLDFQIHEIRDYLVIILEALLLTIGLA